MADRPGERPDTRELLAWTEKLAELVRVYGVSDTGVDWHQPGEAQTAPRREGAAAPARVTATAALSGTRVENMRRDEPAPVNLHRTENGSQNQTPIRGRASQSAFTAVSTVPASTARSAGTPSGTGTTASAGTTYAVWCG